MHANFLLLDFSQFHSPRMHNTRYNRNQVQNSSKIIGLDGRKSRRLDDFVEELKRQIIKLQRLAAKDSEVGKKTEKKKEPVRLRRKFGAKSRNLTSRQIMQALFRKHDHNLYPPLIIHSQTKIHSVLLTILVQLAGSIQCICESNMAKSILCLFETAPINLNKDKIDNTKEYMHDINCYIVDNACRYQKRNTQYTLHYAICTIQSEIQGKSIKNSKVQMNFICRNFHQWQMM